MKIFRFRVGIFEFVSCYFVKCSVFYMEKNYVLVPDNAHKKTTDGNATTTCSTLRIT